MDQLGTDGQAEIVLVGTLDHHQTFRLRRCLKELPALFDGGNTSAEPATTRTGASISSILSGSGDG